MYMWRSEGNFLKLVLSFCGGFHALGSGQGLCGRRFHPLCHPSTLLPTFLMPWQPLPPLTQIIIHPLCLHDLVLFPTSHPSVTAHHQHHRLWISVLLRHYYQTCLTIVLSVTHLFIQLGTHLHIFPPPLLLQHIILPPILPPPIRLFTNWSIYFLPRRHLVSTQLLNIRPTPYHPHWALSPTSICSSSHRPPSHPIPSLMLFSAPFICLSVYILASPSRPSHLAILPSISLLSHSTFSQYLTLGQEPWELGCVSNGWGPEGPPRLSTELYVR